MIAQLRLMAGLIMCLACFGCATLPQANPSGRTFIESDPPGARIEINNQYVGVAPLRVDIPRSLDADLRSAPVTIVASPVMAGQQVQSKYIALDEPTPSHIFFDMNLMSRNNQIDINVNHNSNQNARNP